MVIRSRRVAARLPIAHRLLTLTCPSLLIGSAPEKVEKYTALFSHNFIYQR